MATSMDVLNSVAGGTASGQPPVPAQAGTSMDVLNQVEKDPNSVFRGPQIKPADNSATAQQMAKEGVADYKPGQGLPFGHSGVGMRTGDITPTQAEGGALAIGGAAGVTAAAEALPAVLPHTIAGVKAIGSWASRNPVQAILVLNLLKEVVPGFKQLTGIIKGAPE